MTVRLVCAFQWQRSFKGLRRVCMCACVYVHVYMCVLAGWYCLAAFDCNWGGLHGAHYVRPQHV